MIFRKKRHLVVGILSLLIFFSLCGTSNVFPQRGKLEKSSEIKGKAQREPKTPEEQERLDRLKKAFGPEYSDEFIKNETKGSALDRIKAGEGINGFIPRKAKTSFVKRDWGEYEPLLLLELEIIKYRSKFSGIDNLSEQIKGDVVDFLAEFYARNQDKPIGACPTVIFGSSQKNFLGFKKRLFKICIATKDGYKPINNYEWHGKTKELYEDSCEEWLPIIEAELMHIVNNNKSEHIIFGGNEIEGKTLSEIFNYPTIRLSHFSELQGKNLSNDVSLIYEKLSKISEINPTVFDSLPNDITQLKLLKKNLDNLPLWLRTKKALTQTLSGFKCEQRPSRAESFKQEIIHGNKDIIIIIADTTGERINWLDGSSTSAEDIMGWGPRKAKGPPPLIISLACKTGLVEIKTVGEISGVLKKQQLALGFVAPEGLISPDEAVNFIDSLFKNKINKDNLKDLLEAIGGTIISIEPRLIKPINGRKIC